MARWSFVFLAVMWFALSAFAVQAQQTSSQQPKIHVVIVGVPKWQLDRYKFSSLGDGISDACVAIISFFRARFAPNQLEFHPTPDKACTAEYTTERAIHRLLYTELPSFGNGTLTFVFLMTHGEIVHSHNKFVKNDLRFITSDTTDGDLDGSSVSLGVEILSWLTKLPGGSTVLMFVDTCNSASLDSLKIQLDASMQQYFGLRIGVVAGSLAKETGYNANFTRALLKLWQTHPCPTESFENWIRTEIASNSGVVDLGRFEGYPQVIIPFANGVSWCFSDLSADGKLLFLYQGSARNVLWSIVRQESDDGFRNPRTILVTAPFALQVVPPGHYSITATIADTKATVGPIETDLVTNSTQPVFVMAPNSVQETVEAFRELRKGAAYKGIADSELSKLDRQIDAGRSAIGGRDSYLAGGPPGTPDAAGFMQFGRDMLSKGVYGTASSMFYSAALSAAHTPSFSSKDIQDMAYLAYVTDGIAGNAKGAYALQQKFSLPITPEYSIFDRAVKGVLAGKESVEKLRAAATALYLTKWIDYVAQLPEASRTTRRDQ